MPSQALGVLLGAIFGWGSSIAVILLIGGKAMEWFFSRCCHKRRSRTVDFFMSHYEQDGDIAKRAEGGEKFGIHVQAVGGAQVGGGDQGFKQGIAEV